MIQRYSRTLEYVISVAHLITSCIIFPSISNHFKYKFSLDESLGYKIIIEIGKCGRFNYWLIERQPINSLRPRRNGRYNADDIFKCIFLKENVWIPTKISLKFVANGPINNIPALVQIMAWRRPGDKPLSEPMMVSLLTHIFVTRPQWAKTNAASFIQ